MILIGQYDSPFVRRVGIAMRLYGITFEHRPWSVFADAEKLRLLNPLTRVPTVVLDGGDVLVESHAILDHLDTLVVPEQRLFPVAEPERHRAIAIAALATGLADKAVSLFYETRLHREVSEVWTGRCRAQIGGVMRELESRYAGCPGPWWQGERIGHADIAVATALRFAGEAHPGLIDLDAAPRLAVLTVQAEALPAFSEISQPFLPPT